eukprot:6184784-Pleurochrysis_carterae.AAC.2
MAEAFACRRKCALYRRHDTRRIEVKVRIETEQWIHVTGVFNGKELRIYLNGDSRSRQFEFDRMHVHHARATRFGEGRMQAH